MSPCRMLAALLASLLVLTVTGCGTSAETTTSAASETTAPQANATADEYEVYSALIQSAYIDAIQPKQIIIATVDPHQQIMLAAPAMKSAWADLGGDIMGDFEAKNGTSPVLESRFTLSVPYTLLSEQEVATIFSSSATGWDKFYAKYPDAKGLVALSRVGFNQAKDRAVLYMEDLRGLTDCEGSVVLMKKTDGLWTVEKNSIFWQA